jgi:hypothetical protein
MSAGTTVFVASGPSSSVGSNDGATDDLNPEDILVAVANGARYPRLAAATADDLRGAGFANVTPTDAIERQARTMVYFAGSLAQEGAQVARVLGLDEGRLAPISEAPRLVVDGDFQVVVVLGSDRL